MELNITQQTVPMNEVVFDSAVEQALECDIMLPDYCPDILRILKCDVTCAVASAQAVGERLAIEAMAAVAILYLGENNQMRCIDYKIPFTKTCELKSQPQNPMVDICCKIDYANCRAVSSRRLEVRGAATLKIRVTSCGEEKVVSDCTGMGVQLKKNILDVTECVAQASSPFTVKEELELGYGKPAIGCVISSRMFAVLTDYKVISGKIVTKGELHIQLLYYPAQEGEGDCQPELMEYSLPVSQIIDSANADDECVCNVQYQVTSCEVQPKPDMDGDNRILAITAEIAARANIHRREQMVLSADCYCTAYDCAFKNKGIAFLTLLNAVQDTHSYKETIQLPGNIQAVIYGWSRVTDQNVKVDQGQIVLTFQLETTLLVRDEEGTVQCVTNTAEITHHIPLNGAPCEQILFRPALTPVSGGYSIVGSNQVELRSEILIQGCVYCMVHKNGICEIAVDETKEKPRDKSCALTIYYADQGESIWDIAKKYNTSIQSVIEENALESDILQQRKMLLIPML